MEQEPDARARDGSGLDEAWPDIERLTSMAGPGVHTSSTKRLVDTKIAARLPPKSTSPLSLETEGIKSAGAHSHRPRQPMLPSSSRLGVAFRFQPTNRSCPQAVFAGRPSSDSSRTHQPPTMLPGAGLLYPNRREESRAPSSSLRGFWTGAGDGKSLGGQPARRTRIGSVESRPVSRDRRTSRFPGACLNGLSAQ